LRQFLQQIPQPIDLQQPAHPPAQQQQHPHARQQQPRRSGRRRHQLNRLQCTH
jgi:hypothetical protein